MQSAPTNPSTQQLRQTLDWTPRNPAPASTRMPHSPPRPASPPPQGREAMPLPPASPAPAGKVAIQRDAPPVTWRATLPGGLLVAAGVLHLVLLPAHLAEARGAGLYFCAIGVGQIVWAVFHMRSPTTRSTALGLVAFVIAPIALFAITRIARAPFADEPEAFDTIGMLTKLLEAAAAVPLLLDLRPAGTSKFWSMARPGLVAVVLVSGLALGTATYGAGLAAENVDWLSDADASHEETTDAQADEAPSPGAGPHATALHDDAPSP